MGAEALLLEDLDAERVEAVAVLRELGVGETREWPADAGMDRDRRGDEDQHERPERAHGRPYSGSRRGRHEIDAGWLPADASAMPLTARARGRRTGHGKRRPAIGQFPVNRPTIVC